MSVKLSKWDSAEHLKTEADIALYFDACLEENRDDAAFIAKALGNIARARVMTQLTKDTGLGRESLYKVPSGEGNPSFATILRVLQALEPKLYATQRQGDVGTNKRQHYCTFYYVISSLLDR